MQEFPLDDLSVLFPDTVQGRMGMRAVCAQRDGLAGKVGSGSQHIDGQR